MNHKIMVSIGLTIFSAFSLSMMSLLSKLAQESINANMVIFFRFIIALMIISPLVLKQGASELKTQRLVLHVFRAIAGFSALLCLVYSTKHLHVADALLLNITYPLFIPIIMLVFFKKTINLVSLSSLLLGFLGVILVLQPSQNLLLDTNSLIGLLSGVFTAIAIVLTKQLSSTESSQLIGFYLFSIASFISMVLVLGHWQTPNTQTLLLLLGVGFSGICYQQALTTALKQTHQEIVVPIMFISVIFGCILDWLLWGDTPNHWMAVGFVFILSGVSINYQANRALRYTMHQNHSI